MINRIGNALNKAFNRVKAILTRVDTAATRYGPQLREFVITTADELERLIPDHGFGNVKLMAFDGALKVFVDIMKEDGEAKDEDVAGIWEFAHLILEGYIAAKKAKESAK